VIEGDEGVCLAAAEGGLDLDDGFAVGGSRKSVSRCRKQVHLGLSELGEAGNEARGPLLQALQQVLRRAGEGGQ
jgi:anti-sigma factor ChrR (cupin superfamily)